MRKDEGVLALQCLLALPLFLPLEVCSCRRVRVHDQRFLQTVKGTVSRKEGEEQAVEKRAK